MSDPAPPRTPCNGCAHRPECAAFDVLDKALYSKTTFRRPPAPTSFLPAAVAEITEAELREVARAWLATSASLTHRPDTVVLPALFDFLLSALYAQWLFGFGSTTPQRPAMLHPGSPGEPTDAFFPYVWMCPACVSAGVHAAQCYLPGSELRAGKRYADGKKLSRPGGRMIGDFGALALRIIIETVAATGAHYAAGGGHRGEFDLVIGTDDMLILGEIKASPLVAFPLVATVEEQSREHQWLERLAGASNWSLFVGAADARLPLSAPAGGTWPLPDFAGIARDPDQVETVLSAWERHLAGYRRFNAEAPATRWQRFGCGNIEADGVQLRVDNTKSLPGIDRTDDIKKGLAQVMLFGRLKRGCHIAAIKTVLFGNLFAETHHEHYMKPLASVKLAWPGEQSVWLFDAVLAMSRNIINDEEIATLFPLTNTPYRDDALDADEFVADLAEVVNDAD